eukprot:scaffold126606_cov14-Tisochrysis_lutea.AAC.1
MLPQADALTKLNAEKNSAPKNVQHKSSHTDMLLVAAYTIPLLDHLNVPVWADLRPQNPRGTSKASGRKLQFLEGAGASSPAEIDDEAGRRWLQSGKENHQLVIPLSWMP